MKRLLLILAFLCVGVPAMAQPASGPWSRVIFGSDAGPYDSSGTGSPEAVVSACPGSVYRQTDAAAGNALWVKDGGTGCDTTGWVVPIGGGGSSPHSLLSATHSDTLAFSVVRGALVYGNSTPAWSRLSVGAAGSVLRSDGNEPGWSTDGSSLTISGTNITSGTVPDARLSASVSLLGSSIDSSEITNGTIVFADWASNSCATNDVPKWSGSAWACATDQTGSGGSFANVCQSGEFDAGNSGTSITLNWNNGASQIVTLNNNLATLTLSNPVAGCTYRIEFVEDGTGGRTIAFPSSIKFENDTTPSVITTADKVIFCSMVYTTVGADGYFGWCTTNPLSKP